MVLFVITVSEGFVPVSEGFVPILFFPRSSHISFVPTLDFFPIYEMFVPIFFLSF